MILINDIIENYSNNKDKYQGYSLDYINLEQWEANKSRIKKQSNNGKEIAISLDRGKHLHNNDVLFIDENNKEIILVKIELKNVLKITLPQDVHLQTLFKLGHALGNQHWPALLHENYVLVPLYVDEKIMRSMLKTHNFDDIHIEFIEGNEVAKYLNSSDFRLLFSGDDTSVHKHH